jgi:hypothetical protein
MQPAPDHDAEDGELEPDSLRAAFPQFRIWREFLGGRPRYVARRLDPGTRPHTVITTEPAELRAALTKLPARTRGPGGRGGRRAADRQPPDDGVATRGCGPA